MNLRKMMGSWEGATKVAAIMAASNVGLVLVALLLAFKMSSMHERVTLVPPHLEKRATIGWNTADAEYMKGFAMWFAMLTGNVTPKSVTVTADILSGFVAPAIYPDVRKQILALAKDPAFNSSGGSVRFDPNDILYEAQSNKVFVLGDTTTQDASGRTNKQNAVVELEIRIENGRPLVTGMWNYPGNEAHTLEWHERRGAAIEQAQAERKE